MSVPDCFAQLFRFVKIRPEFNKKVVLKLKIQKNNFDKKYAPKFLSFNEKNWKDLDEFFTQKDTDEIFTKENHFESLILGLFIKVTKHPGTLVIRDDG